MFSSGQEQGFRHAHRGKLLSSGRGCLTPIFTTKCTSKPSHLWPSPCLLWAGLFLHKLCDREMQQMKLWLRKVVFLHPDQNYSMNLFMQQQWFEAQTNDVLLTGELDETTIWTNNVLFNLENLLVHHPFTFLHMSK